MSVRKFTCAWFILMALAVPYAWADPSVIRTVHLQEVLERALSESPLVARIEASIASSRAAGLHNGSIENPTLDGEVRIPTSYDDRRGSDEIALAVSQPLRLSDFGARSRVNRLVQAIADTDRKIELLTFSQRVKLAYTKAWALERRSAELARYRETAARIERAVKHATDGGLLGASEGLLFKAEATKAQLELDAVSSDLKRARAELHSTVGFMIQGALARPPLAEPPALEELIAAQSTFSAQARATLALKLAREQERQAELESYPAFTPRLVYERTNDYTDYFGVGISVELPFFNRNQGERLANTARVHATERFAAYYSPEAYREEVAALLLSLRAATAFLNGYENEILPTLSEALSAEEELFDSGKGVPARLWQILRELSAAQSEVLERLIRLYSDRIELVTVTGMDF